MAMIYTKPYNPHMGGIMTMIMISAETLPPGAGHQTRGETLLGGRPQLFRV